MKEFTGGLSILIAVSCGSLFAAPVSTPPSIVQGPDCTQLTEAEQDFAAQIMDMNNKTAFCSQFTLEQRDQCMQLLGQPDNNGNPMNADQACMQVMGSNTPMTQQKSTGVRGGCPVQ